MNCSTLLLAVALTSSFGLASDKSSSQTSPNDAALREQGKKIFVNRCAQCHDEDANKKLPDGTTLLQRLAKSKDPEARLQARLKNPQERHAVMIYLAEFLPK